jgi:hypothetical protein
MSIVDKEQLTNILGNEATGLKRISLRINRYLETGDERELEDARNQAERGFGVIRCLAEELGLDLDMEHLELHALDETEGEDD